jgi:hypothetical protein
MTFNAVMLEKELRPIKEEVEKLRKAGKTAQVRMHTAPSAVGRPTALLLLCSCAIV